MNELKQRRKELGITQIQAANACGISRRTYQTYEETSNLNSSYLELVKKLNEIEICSVKVIKEKCSKLFKEKYPEIESAYLFGSYARGEATGNSDIDIVVVCPPMGMKFYGVASELEELLHKKIDLHTHRQLLNNEKLLEELLNDGIKIY